MQYPIIIIIPGELPGMNEIIAVSKKRYILYSQMKKQYTAVVSDAAEGYPQLESADFIIHWFCKNNRKDKDNIIAGQKFIFDGLVHAGVLPNDGWKEIGDITHRLQVDKNNPRIEVEILNYEVLNK